MNFAPGWAAGGGVSVFIPAAMTLQLTTQIHIHRGGRVEKKHFQISVSSLGSLCRQKEDCCSTNNVVQVT